MGGKVIMCRYITGSMQRAIDETNRRRQIQIAAKHGITLHGQKAVRDIEAKVAETRAPTGRGACGSRTPCPSMRS